MASPMGPMGSGPGLMPGLQSFLGAPFVGNINVSWGSSTSTPPGPAVPLVTWLPQWRLPSVPVAMGTSGLPGLPPQVYGSVSKYLII